MRNSLTIVGLMGLLAPVACSSSSDGHGSSSDPATSEDDSYLSKDARADLAAIDAEKFRDEAVVLSEEEQPNGFTKVTYDPASGPICLRGGAFTAFYSDRDSDKTIVILNGGGACWSGFCAASTEASTTAVPIGPASDGPDRYFGDWNVVIASYCDGSVFSGANEVVEPTGDTRYHHGRQNLTATFELAGRRFPGTKQVLVAGFSAGGYGTIPGMVAARLAYPKADLFVLDDSGPGVQNLDAPEGIEQRLSEWRFADTIPASCTACDGGRGQLTSMFTWMLERDSNIKISVSSFYEDTVIGNVFLGLPGAAYKSLLVTETGKVEAAFPDRFRRFMLPGLSHVVSVGWQTATADGTGFSDWTAGMVTGDAVWQDLLAEGP